MATTSNTTPNNLIVFRGDDLPFNFNFTDSNQNPIPITGWTLYFTVKNNEKDTDTQAVLAETYTTFTSPAAGIMNINIPHTSTANLLGTYYYDFRFKTNTDLVFVITSGTITFKQDTSQRARLS